MLAAGTQLGPYNILSRLGAGGMGEVYLAEDTRLKRKVALKLLPAQFTQDADRVRRLKQEAIAASALNHPNIITIHEIGEAGGMHYLAAEFIDGQTLRQQMTNERLKLSTALEVVIQTASALSAAHEAGIIHRDIKPENVMVRRDGYVKVLDFGLAKLTERRARETDTGAPTMASIKTDPGTLMGTVSYMSPEQARGVDMDARTDIFSLGVLLYEMIAGRLPFEGETTTDVFVSILEKEPTAVSRHAPEVPAELQRIIGKALRKNREERYQTVKDMLLDLKSLKEELIYEAKSRAARRPGTGDGAMGAANLDQGLEAAKLAGTPIPGAILARRTSSAEYVVSEIKRHKLAALVALAVLALSIMGLAFYWHARTTEVAIESIAILPFDNQNHDQETEYLSDGLTESIINNLTQLSALRVIARSSVFRYKGKASDPLGAGQALGVRAVVTGRVLQRGENLTISAELVDVRENKQLWGQQYNRKLADVFAMQEEIAKEISEKLRLKLTGAERQQLAKRPTGNLKAFQYYMQGQTHAQRLTREDTLAAIRYYERAIAEDRNYALAYSGLAAAYRTLGVFGYLAPIEARRKWEEAARKALALDETLAEAHAAFGFGYCQWAPSNFSLGDRELRRAIELSPSLASAHHYLGLSLVQQGRLDESLEELLKARELDPLSPTNARAVALPYYLKRDFVRALELLRQVNELGPPFSSTWEIGVYIQNRLSNEALTELEKAKHERKSNPILLFNTGTVYAAQGKRAEALQIIKELDEMSGASLTQAHRIAKIYATLNDNEPALTWLERGLAAGAIGAFYKDEPVWDTIRGDPRFGDLLRRMGITP